LKSTFSIAAKKVKASRLQKNSILIWWSHLNTTQIQQILIFLRKPQNRDSKTANISSIWCWLNSL